MSFSSFVWSPPFHPLICRRGVECHPVVRHWFSVSLLRLRLDRRGFSGFSVEIGVGGGGVSLRCSCLMASISPVSIALYSSSVNVKNSETDLS